MKHFKKVISIAITAAFCACSTFDSKNEINRAISFQNQTAVWIDADPSVGEKDRDVDDGLALIQAFNSPELDIKGISVVFGNTDLQKAIPIANFAVTTFGPQHLAELVFPGASGSSDLGKETQASKAIADALRKEKLSILALGPMTNVATAIKNHPEIVGNIKQVIAVAGRRPGQRFTSGEKNKKGHRDFNFELDPEAFQVLIDMNVPLVLAPFEISSKIWINEEDIKSFANGTSATKWLAQPAKDWLSLWQRVFFVNGFNPFDTLAITYLTSPTLIQCEILPGEIQVLADDSTEYYMQGKKVDSKPYLLASKDLKSQYKVKYCYNSLPDFKRDLFERLFAQ